MNPTHTISLDSAASEFLDGFPIGSGKVAAMIYGSYPEDKISLNHEWLWSANYRGKKTPDKVADKLPHLRKLLREGKYIEANQFGNDTFSPRGGMSPIKERIDQYSDAGYFHFGIEFGCIKYERTLNMQNGLVRSEFSFAGITFFRECFADLNSNIIYYRVYNNKHQSFNSSCYFSRAYRKGDNLEFETNGNFFAMQGEEAGNIKFRNEAKVFADGAEILNRNNQILINNAKEVIVAISIDVNTGNKDKFDNILQTIEKPDWDSILDKHTQKWQKYYNRFSPDCQGFF